MPILYVLFNIGAAIGGTVLLSLQFGWKAGVGILLIAYFLKQPER